MYIYERHVSMPYNFFLFFPLSLGQLQKKRKGGKKGKTDPKSK